MIKSEEHSAQAIYVGADLQLGEQLRATIEAKAGWSLQHVVDVDIVSTIQSEQQTSVTLLYAEDEYSYAQSLKFLRATTRSESPTVVIYDQLEASQLLELFRSGAAECLGRPLNLSRLSLVVDMVSAPKRAAKGSTSVAKGVDNAHGTGLQKQLMEQVRQVAALNTTVLITGETGTGKTRLSRLIHGLSNRKEKPFLALNCGALSESLLDTELFGHVKGAFTGADHDYAGKLSQCKDGTLLLDEIDMLSSSAQVKLLQVVEDRVFQPVGSAGFQPLQARLIVASNRPLQTEVNEGRFRSDLFYRLNVMSFQLPPLRERRHEIQQLAIDFAAEFADQHGFESAPIAAHTISALEAYAWPGNIRELRNVMERAVILAAGNAIEPRFLPVHVAESGHQRRMDADSLSRRKQTSANKLADARIEAEREQLLSALDRNDNNRSKTALDLGISRVALYKRLRKLHIL